METLKYLTPAETLLLRDGGQVSFKDMLKFTLTDLILKNVLKITKNDETEEENPEMVNRYVEIGNHFHDYTPKYHEEIYLYPFKKEPELSIQFKHLIKMGWENARNRGHFIFKQLMVSDSLKYCFKEGWFYRVFQSPKFTDEGREKRRQVSSELNRLEETLPSLMENDPEGVKKLIGHIYGNILLIKSFDKSFLKEFEQAFDYHGASPYAWNDMDTAAIFFLFMFDDYSMGFDSEYDSFTGSDSWGGTGGCSDGGGDGGGCSGCGGCGGCGG